MGGLNAQTEVSSCLAERTIGAGSLRSPTL
jgi:hypothetical protein